MNQFSDQSSWFKKLMGMQGPKRILIKSVQKAPSKIKIKKKLMDSDDVRILSSQFLQFNKIIPLKPQTIQDFMEKTSEFFKRSEPKRTSLIRIKSVRLYKDRFTP